MQRNRISSSISESITKLCLALLMILPLSASAQNRRKASVEPADSTPVFNGIEVSADLVGIGQMLVSDYGQYEAALRVNLKDRYFPILEAGLGKADAEDDVTHISYKTSAPYFRIGCDFNVLKNKHDIYRVYVGVRYAFTSYKYDLSSPAVTDPVWGGSSDFAANDVKCSYHWMEAGAGIQVKIYGPIHLGWSVRYKRRITSDDGELGETWYVPGYGKQGNSRLGATFNVIVQL